MTILSRLIPSPASNVFPGQKVALYAFIPLCLMLVVRSTIHLVAPDGGAQSIATIPLDQYSEGGAMNIVAIFSQWGLSQLLLALVFVLVLVRYRSLIPLFYFLFMLEQIGRATVGHFKPIETLAAAAPGENGNLPLLLVATLMFILSLIPPKSAREPDA